MSGITLCLTFFALILFPSDYLQTVFLKNLKKKNNFKKFFLDWTWF
jgi:hypothetical protein